MVDVEALVQEALPSIVEGMKQELRQSINWDVKSAVTKQVTEHVTEWVKVNVLPAITAELIESKDGLVSAGSAMAPLMVTALTESLMGEFTKRLSTSWERSKIFEACFK